MRISLTAVTVSGDQKLVVDFTSQAGAGRALWTSESIRPIPLASYDVEFDIDAVASMEVLTSQSLGVSCANDDCLLRVQVEAVDEDGVVTIRIAEDCIVLVDSLREVSVGANLQIRVPVDSFRCTPFGM